MNKTEANGIALNTRQLFRLQQLQSILTKHYKNCLSRFELKSSVQLEDAVTSRICHSAHRHLMKRKRMTQLIEGSTLDRYGYLQKKYLALNT
jgi:hypothetical protein